jgi:hypothetical protein
MTERLNQATESEENDPFKITTDNALSPHLMKEALLVLEKESPSARDRV